MRIDFPALDIAHEFTPTNELRKSEGDGNSESFSFVPQNESHTPKTAWEYYNESMEIIDRQRERDWIEQMDTTLIFVCPIHL